ncbi:hypothetical protein M8J75_000773 [Diaphorina citri]|nr:hypothetical protein M8J75_000773 [Diaphorina citri]
MCLEMCVQAVRRPQLIPMSLVSSFELILTTPLQFQLCFAAVAVQDSRLKSMHRIQNLEMKRGERRKN